jgi:hypothetical protein
MPETRIKHPSDLTAEEIKKSVLDLIEYYDFSFFYERDTDVGLGLTYGLEMQAISLGLVGQHLYETPTYSTPEMMEEFVMLLDSCAMSATDDDAIEDLAIKRAWLNFRGSLPYARGVCATTSKTSSTTTKA